MTIYQVILLIILNQIKTYIVIRPDQPLTYILITKGQIISDSQKYVCVRRLTDYGKFAITCRGAQIWNKLPKELKILKSYILFENSTKVYVRDNMYSQSRIILDKKLMLVLKLKVLIHLAQSNQYIKIWGTCRKAQQSLQRYPVIINITRYCYILQQIYINLCN